MYREKQLLKKQTYLLLICLVLGIVCACGFFFQSDGQQSSRLYLLRIYIVSRAGGILGADVFWQTMKKSLRMAALWGCACISGALYVLGCAALFLEGFSFCYTLCCLLKLGQAGTWLLCLCMFLPQNLLLWCAYICMGLLTARHMTKKTPQAKSKYMLLFFACLAACILIALLHAAFTLKLMKLLPVAV